MTPSIEHRMAVRTGPRRPINRKCEQSALLRSDIAGTSVGTRCPEDKNPALYFTEVCRRPTAITSLDGTQFARPTIRGYKRVSWATVSTTDARIPLPALGHRGSVEARRFLNLTGVHFGHRDVSGAGRGRTIGQTWHRSPASDPLR
jgi:hypothetical protein